LKNSKCNGVQTSALLRKKTILLQIELVFSNTVIAKMSIALEMGEIQVGKKKN